MKKLAYIFSLLLAVSVLSCVDEPMEARFKDLNKFTAYEYMKEDSIDRFSSFLAILEKGGLDKSLSAYNPQGNGYTLFLPDNNAVNNFINQSQRFSSLDDILNDQEYAATFSRYHVVNMGVHSNDFPFGAFVEPTLSGDYLTVSFIIETDTSYYKINNQASVIRPNIKVSNGFVHEIQSALTPIAYTSYQWLEQNQNYSIFKAAVDLTGLKSAIDFNLKDEENRQPITVFAEPDSIFKKNKIHSIDDLKALISPSNTDYTNRSNPLYNFVAYHFLTGRYFINDFIDVNTNYSTYSEVPLNINGLGLDIAINKGKEVFDTIVYKSDTTFIDFIKFDYDASNVITQSGAMHFIDRVMKRQIPSRAIRTFAFYEEPLFNNYHKKDGSFLIENNGALTSIEWSGADLFFVDLGEQQSSAWNNDYLFIDGDFIITYTIPKIVQGKYTVILGAETFNESNALVEVFIDRNKVGGLIDLSTGGSASYPFRQITLGTIDFQKFSEHTVEIRSLIPGRFLWDYIRFEPN